MLKWRLVARSALASLVVLAAMTGCSESTQNASPSHSASKTESHTAVPTAVVMSSTAPLSPISTWGEPDDGILRFEKGLRIDNGVQEMGPDSRGRARAHWGFTPYDPHSWFAFDVCTWEKPITITAVRPIITVGKGFTIEDMRLGETNDLISTRSVDQAPPYPPQSVIPGAVVEARCDAGDLQQIHVLMKRTGPDGGGILGLEVSYVDSHGRESQYGAAFDALYCGASTTPCETPID